MRRLLALTVALVAYPALAAVETTTVTGKVLTPSGAAATAGSVTCELSQAASTTDGTAVQRVAMRTADDLDGSGNVSLALVPNDVMTPAGTYYSCRFSVRSPSSGSWMEKWSISSTVDPIDIGSISRIAVAPGVTTGTYVVALSTCSGACPAGGVCLDRDTAATYYCTAGAWVQADIPVCSPDPPRRNWPTTGPRRTPGWMNFAGWDYWPIRPTRTRSSPRCIATWP